MKRTRTTYTMTEAAAKVFENWLRRNANDRDYGYPKFIDRRGVGHGEFCVEYESESDFARGFATGCDAMARAL